MATQIGSKGSELDLLIRQGATFGPVACTLTNPDTSPVNLTGCTFRGQMRKTASDLLSTGCAFTFVITNATLGQFTIEITDENTTALAADVVSETGPSSQYVYDVEMEDASGRVIPILFGKAQVFREVTKVT